VPLEFCAGGLGMSTSHHNNTIKLAGKAGFGWCGWEEGYMDKNLAILKWKFMGKESPLFIPSLPDAHNYGITYAPEKFATIFDTYPDKRFISINEFIGYLHSNNSGNWINSNEISLSLDYDPHYCSYFKKHSTNWNLEIADWLITEKGDNLKIMVDGKSVKSNFNIINVPAGLGGHNIKIEF
jgi:hypothetical protein